MVPRKLLLNALVLPACLALGGCTTMTPRLADSAGSVLPSVPAQPDPRSRYVFYLHSIGLDQRVDEERMARFNAMTAALARTGATVIAEVRGPGTIRKTPEDLDTYGRKVASQIDQLLAARVPARNIQVVGYSRGGVLAQITAGHVARPDIGYVILAGCVSDRGAVKQFVPVQMGYARKLKGRFLSVVESSDGDFASCAPYFAQAAAQADAREIVVSTGKGHLAFVEPDEAWLRPVTEWIRAR